MLDCKMLRLRFLSHHYISRTIFSSSATSTALHTRLSVQILEALVLVALEDVANHVITCHLILEFRDLIPFVFNRSAFDSAQTDGALLW